MADAMDAAQDFNLAHVEDALRRHAQRQRTTGLTCCEVSDCREPIRPERTALGARLCDECQDEDDRRRAAYGGRGRW